MRSSILRVDIHTSFQASSVMLFVASNPENFVGFVDGGFIFKEKTNKQPLAIISSGGKNWSSFLLINKD